MKVLCVAAMLAAAAPALAAAQAGPCRLALAFALDVSASVDENEYRLQLDGLAAGLNDPTVRAAVLGPGGGIAMAAYEWSGKHQQAMIAPWTLVTTDAALDALAARVSVHRRRYGEFPTAVGFALGYGAVLLRDAPPCLRRVIDISGDGLLNDGFGPDAAYREFEFEGVTVNGLVIGGEDLELISFYQFTVAHGPGAFVEVARDYTDYRRAMLRKLLREIAGDFVAERPAGPENHGGRGLKSSLAHDPEAATKDDTPPPYRLTIDHVKPRADDQHQPDPGMRPWQVAEKHEAPQDRPR
jgi:hypothetical protein